MFYGQLRWRLKLSDVLDIVRETAGEEARYRVEVDGYSGHLLYRDVGTSRGVVRHAYSTRVDKALSGRGVGLALVKRLVEDAREERAIINPQCSFVRVMIGRNKDWADVLVEDGR